MNPKNVTRRAAWLHGENEGSAPLFWNALAWAGSLGLGLTVFLFVGTSLHFEPHPFDDIVATPAFALYPEQQDWWLYIIALVVVPFFTLVGRRVWSLLVALMRNMQPGAVEQVTAYVTLIYGLWDVHPITFLFLHRLAPLPPVAVLGVFIIANGVLLSYYWCQHGAASNPSLTPPPLRTQGAVALLGGVVGASLLESPLGEPFLVYPMRTVLGFAVLLWAVWLGGTRWLSQRSGQQWRRVAEGVAMSGLPLSLLSLQSTLWWEVNQTGKQVASYGSKESALFLLMAATVGAIGVFIRAIGWPANRERELGRRFWQYFSGMSVPLLLYMLAYNPNIHGPLDMFHEGERVSPAQAIMAGGVPYKDVVFVHGFLRDPGVAMASFRLFGPSISSLRRMERLLQPLALVATYYLALVCLGKKWALLYSMSMLTGLWPLFYDWRIVPCVLAIVCLLVYIRRERLVWASCASLLTALALATSFDVGMVSLFTGSAFVSAYTAAHWRRVRLRLLLAYVLPLSVFVASACWYFLRAGALSQAIDWHREILQVYRDWNGMPFPAHPDTLGKAWEILLCPLSTMIAAITLAVAAVRKRWVQHHWDILVLTVANTTLFNRAIVSGQSGSSAVAAGSHFASILLLLMLLPSHDAPWRRWGKPLLTYALSLSLLLPTPTHPKSGHSLLDIVNHLPGRTRVEIAGSWARSDIERVGRLFIPSDQEHSLADLVAFLQRADSFWDFSDHGALYFLTNRRSPTRFYATHHIITADNQREVVKDLAQSPPRFVVFRSGTGWDAIAGVDRCLRSFLVSEYLLRNYHPVEQMGGFVILEQGAPTSVLAEPAFYVDLGYVPYLWGKERYTRLQELQPVSVTRWYFSSLKGETGWQPAHDILRSEITSNGWYIRTSGSDPQVVNLSLALDPCSVTYLVLRLHVGEHTHPTTKWRLFWRSDSRSFSEERSLAFDAVADGQEHAYLLRLISFPSWTWGGTVTGLRLDPGSEGDLEATVASIEFIKVDELGDVQDLRP